MKKTAIVLALVLAGVADTTFAQDTPAQAPAQATTPAQSSTTQQKAQQQQAQTSPFSGMMERQSASSMAEVYDKEADKLIKSMKLEKKKRDMFKALYMDYQNARFNVVNPNGGDQEAKENAVDLKTVTDENADSLIQKSFARQEREIAIDKEYYKKFLDVLTPSQAAYVFLSPSANAMTPGRMMGSMMSSFGGGGMMGGFGGGGMMMGGGGFGGGFGGGGFGGF